MRTITLQAMTGKMWWRWVGLAVALIGAASGHTQELFDCKERNAAGKFTVQSRIVGGQDTNIDDVPWQVVVYPGQYLCGGSIISPSWVLTAAHCIAGYAPNDVFVGYGSSNRSDMQMVAVATTFVHEKWNEKASQGNDIALIKLASPLPLVKSHPAKLQLVSKQVTRDLIKQGNCTVVSGWGAIREDGPFAATLQRVDLPVISRNNCEQQLRSVDKSFKLAADQFCAGGDAKHDSCQGDSGGPLVTNDPISAPEGDSAVQLGVVSWGFGCAQKGLPGVYTDVGYHLDWILKKYSTHSQ
jgi:trypsin